MLEWPYPPLNNMYVWNLWFISFEQHFFFLKRYSSSFAYFPTSHLEPSKQEGCVHFDCYLIFDVRRGCKFDAWRCHCPHIIWINCRTTRNRKFSGLDRGRETFFRNILRSGRVRSGKIISGRSRSGMSYFFPKISGINLELNNGNHALVFLHWVSTAIIIPE